MFVEAAWFPLFYIFTSKRFRFFRNYKQASEYSSPKLQSPLLAFLMLRATMTNGNASPSQQTERTATIQLSLLPTDLTTNCVVTTHATTTTLTASYTTTLVNHGTIIALTWIIGSVIFPRRPSYLPLQVSLARANSDLVALQRTLRHK